MSTHAYDRNISDVNNSHEKDLSEGVDEMKLIQQVEIEIKTEIADNTSENISSEKADEIEVFSSTVFTKYNIVESHDGYYITNIRNQKRQYLSRLIGRRSISIKLMKNNSHVKGFTIISSYNRDSRPSVNDRVIGYLFRDGRILRFETSSHDRIIDIRV